MSKPLLLSSGSGKVLEFVGTATGQLPTWSQSAQEWVLGTNGGSGGGGAIFYLNSAAAADTPTTNVPGGTGGATAYFTPAQLSQTFNATASTRLSPPTGELPSNGSWAIVQGLLSDDALGLTALPPGLWDFNIWAKASTGAGPSQVEFRVRVGVYADSTNTLTYLFDSDSIFIYDPTVAAQYPASVVIGSNTIAATDRLYVEVNARSSANNRTATFYFGGDTPSHVHTTIQVPVNLATGVTGTLPVANGGTGVTTVAANTVFAGPSSGGNAAPGFRTLGVAEVTGAAPLDSPTFTGTPLSTTAAVDTNTTQVATTAYVVGQGYAKLASPAFTGTPSLPTGTTGFTQSAGNNTTALATTAFVTTAVAASSGAPYDLPFEIPGTPATSTKVVNFKAVRAFALAATGHQGGQITAPSGNFVCTVMKNGASIGTITFGTSSFSSSVTATSFATGDVLSVETPAAALGIDTPFATLFMTLV